MYIKTSCMSSDHLKFQKNRHKTQCTHCLFNLIVNMSEQWQSSTCGKKLQKNLRIISKLQAYLQTMSKTTVKFKRNRHKTVGGVAHTRYQLSIHFDCKNALK